MYFLALASDHDGTLAHHGIVGEAAVQALRRLKETERRLILVAGREPPKRVRVTGPRQALRRHIRKYAEGELGADRSFYFLGPEGAWNLHAQNLSLFVQIAAGVDDATWQHHLAAGDYSHWVRSAIKDDELAAELAEIERDLEEDALESREQIKAAIERRYTGPAA